MACKATWTFSKGQEYMWWNNVETKPYGGYPQHWDVKILEHAGRGAPGGRRARPSGTPARTDEQSALRHVQRHDDLRSGRQRRTQQALGYLPDDKEWRAPNFYEDTATAYKGD